MKRTLPAFIINFTLGGKALKLRSDKRGFTLVEALVGTALFVICGLILVTGFSAAGSMIRKGLDLKTKGQQAAAAIEGADDLSSDIQTKQTDGSLVITIDGTTVTVNGQYKTAQDSSGNPIFSEFVPSP